jgi:hypothetical protein
VALRRKALRSGKRPVGPILVGVAILIIFILVVIVYLRAMAPRSYRPDERRPPDYLKRLKGGAWPNMRPNSRATSVPPPEVPMRR